VGRNTAARQNFLIAASLAPNEADWRRSRDLAAALSPGATAATVESDIRETSVLRNAAKFFADMPPDALLAIIRSRAKFITAIRVNGCSIVTVSVFPFPAGQMTSELPVRTFDDSKSSFQLYNRYLLYRPYAGDKAVVTRSARETTTYDADLIPVKDENPVNFWDMKLAYAALVGKLAANCR
jgi:hypothetical protein